MRDYGETDLDKKKIRINKKKSKNGGPGQLLNTIVHEETHARHPKMHERTVRKKTKSLTGRMSKTTKQKYYSKYQ